jgi:predicted DCC family thiol-disulfide oxidoreductase YuxK
VPTETLAGSISPAPPAGSVPPAPPEATNPADILTRGETLAAAATPAHTAGPRLAVIYDGGCGVCRETVRRLRRWDHERRFEFMPLEMASSCGRPQLEALAAEGHLADAVHVVDETTGRVVSGGHAALAILDALPGGWLLRPWAALPPTAAAADVVYRVAVRHRDRIAWLAGVRDEVSCPVGSAPGRHSEPAPGPVTPAGKRRGSPRPDPR